MITSAKTQPRQARWLAWLALTFGLVCYVIFFGTAVYSIGFVGDLVVPKSIDSGAVISPALAILIDMALLGVFALQHSVMARAPFKQWWTHVVPRPIERSVYVLFASLALLLLYWQWRPLPESIWNVTGSFGQSLILALYGVGWLIVVWSTFLIDHSDLFGLRQVYAFWRGKDNHTAPAFKTPTLYRFVRHPMMVGFLLAFWATAHMTVGHLLFSLATTAYIIVGVHFEERDLLRSFGETYRRYQRKVRMFLPFPKRVG
jgi:protein-S-isoprenylcysteine O-methyltransferase Ste14